MCAAGAKPDEQRLLSVWRGRIDCMQCSTHVLLNICISRMLTIQRRIMRKKGINVNIAGKNH